MIEKRRKFGEELAQRRTEKGVSLEEMARVTKIRKPVLEALEAGRFEELPPEVFAVGFLKIYAAQVGLNPVQLVAQYRRLTHEFEPDELQEAPVSSSAADSLQNVLVGVLVVALLLGGAGYLYYAHQTGLWPFAATGRQAPSGEAPAREAGPTAHVPPPSSKPGTTASLPPAAGTGTEAGAQIPAEPTAPTAGAPPAPAQENRPQDQAAQQPSATVPSEPQAPPRVKPAGDLVLSCSAASWVELWADGKRVLYRQMAAGEDLAFSGKHFRFNIGNAPGVQVTWKGTPVELPSGRGRVVKDFVLPPQSEGGAGQ
jgi:cytoskeleton protein RodZ